MEGGPLGGGAYAGVVRSRHRKWGAKMASEPQGHGEPEDDRRQRDHALRDVGSQVCARETRVPWMVPGRWHFQSHLPVSGWGLALRLGPGSLDLRSRGPTGSPSSRHLQGVPMGWGLAGESLLHAGKSGVCVERLFSIHGATQSLPHLLSAASPVI